MSILPGSTLNRRLAVGVIAASALGAQVPIPQRARAITQRGIVGGGLVQYEGGEAQFSLGASRTIFPEGEEVISGSVIWVDTFSGTTFTSTAISSYEVVEMPPGEGERRVLRGTMRRDDAEEYPFVLDVLDAGPPGSRLDTAALIVGDGAMPSEAGTPVSGLGYSYAAAGALIGDVQVVDIDLEVGTLPESGAATPSP